MPSRLKKSTRPAARRTQRAGRIRAVVALRPLTHRRLQWFLGAVAFKTVGEAPAMIDFVSDATETQMLAEAKRLGFTFDGPLKFMPVEHHTSIPNATTQS